MQIIVAELTAESFSAHVGKQFRFVVAAPTGSIELHLTMREVKSETRAYALPNTNGRREAFSVLFTGECESPFRQGMGTLQHEDFGAADIFVTRVTAGCGQAGEPRPIYEAVFG